MAHVSHTGQNLLFVDPNPPVGREEERWAYPLQMLAMNQLDIYLYPDFATNYIESSKTKTLTTSVGVFHDWAVMTAR